MVFSRSKVPNALTFGVAALVACAGDDERPAIGGDGDAAVDSGAADGGGAEPGPRDAGEDRGAADATTSSRTVFVTSLLYGGTLGGVAGADAKCAERAQAAGRPGTYRAWLSLTATDDPETRFSRAATPYRRTDGVVVANDWADLTSGGLRAAIDVDENGASITGDAAVWTGTLPNGTAKGGPTCQTWSSSGAGEAGGYGTATATGVTWTDAAIGPCDVSARLYCFEQ